MSRMFFDLLEVNIASSVILLVLCFGAEKLRKRYGASWMKLVWLLLAFRLIVPYNFSLPFTEIKFFSTPDFEQGESVFNNTSEVQENIVTEDNREIENYGKPEFLQEAKEINISVEHNDSDTIPSNNTMIISDKEDAEEITYPTAGVLEVAVAERESISYTEIMTKIWILGIIITFFYNLFCYLCFSLEYKRGVKEITDEELKWKIFEMQELFIGEPLPIYRSRSIFSPMLIGIIKPRLVVPSCMKQWNDDELEMIVAHELCHYKKKDVLLKLFMVVTCCLNWFNPLVYWMKKQFYYDMELACDGTVLMGRSEEERESYARIMLAFAGKAKQLSAFSTGFSESKRSMRKRIDYMLDTGRRKNGILSITLACVVIMTITAFVSCGYTSPEIEEESNHEQEGIVTGQSNEHGTQEDIEEDSAPQEPLNSFDYNHEYNEMLRIYEGNTYLAGADGIYCITADGEKELIYENAYHNLRGMEIYQDWLYFCGSAPNGEKDAATIYRMNLKNHKVEDALSTFSHLFVGFDNISIYEGKLYVSIGNGKRLGFELAQNGQITRLLETTKADFLFREQNEYVELEVKKWNVAFDSEEYWSIVEELNEKYCPVIDIAACKKLLQGKQVVSKYKDEMYRSIYLEKEDGSYEFLCDTVHSLSPLVTETGVYYAINERGEIGYVEYVTKTPQEIYAIDGTEEVALVNYDAEYVYLVKKSYLDWEAGENSAKEVSLLRIPRAGGQAETIYQLEGDLAEYGWPVQCAVYEDHIYFQNQDIISLGQENDTSTE